jgi:hypothetical protein
MIQMQIDSDPFRYTERCGRSLTEPTGGDGQQIVHGPNMANGLINGQV